MSQTNLTFKDKMLPIQPVFREFFEGDEQSLFAALYGAITRFGGLKLPDEELELQLSEKISIEEMASSPMLLRFLQMLILIKQPKRILEIGTFIGLSAMYMARVLPQDGQVVTIEKYDHFADIARQNFTRNALHQKIQLIEGDAFEELRRPDLTRKFDMVFLDGNKERYHQYFELVDPLLVPLGLLVVDDVFFHGDVLNEKPKTEKGLGVRKFLEAIETNDNYYKAILPIGNGIMLMLKRDV
jgi:caffeoyl-CoA O-methyltransferase/O-methyltransferase